MRQLIETHAGRYGPEGQEVTGLHIVLNANHMLGSDLEAAAKFNRLSCADRVRAAKRLLEQQGAKDLALPTWMTAKDNRAFDAASASPQAQRLWTQYRARPIRIAASDAKPRNDRAARCHRALDRVLDKLEERKRRRPARDCNRERRRDDFDMQVAADAKLRDHSEETYRAGERESGVVDDYARAAFAYRPGPARAADAGQDDWAWILGGAGGARSCTGGVL
jgi:hypothetical protein